VRDGQVLSAGGCGWPSGSGRGPVGGHAGPGPGIAFSLEHKALQDLSYDRDFDAVITVDAMENIPPEDWPLVLANLHRAVRPDGVMYLTVEEVDQSRIDQVFPTRWLGMSASRWVGMTGDGKGPAGGAGGALWCPGCRGGARVVAG
jgi:SAM-dependent methyltransferase